MKEVLGPRTLSSYMVGCTAGLLACELGLHTLEGVGEALLEMGLVCGLPTLAGKLAEGSIVKHFRETGSITYLPLVMGGATAAGISLSTLTHGYYYSFLANRYIGRLADIYEKSLKLEKLPAGGERYVVAKRRFFTFLSRDMLESLVNDELRAAYGDQILSYARADPTVKLQLLRMAEKDPDAVAAIKFLCEAGKCGEALEAAVKGGRTALLSKYTEEIINTAEKKLFIEYLSKEIPKAQEAAYREAVARVVEDLASKELRNHFVLPSEVVAQSRKTAWREILGKLRSGEIKLSIVPTGRLGATQAAKLQLKEEIAKVIREQLSKEIPDREISTLAGKIAKTVNEKLGKTIVTEEEVLENLSRIDSLAKKIRTNYYRNYLKQIANGIRSGKIDPEALFKLGRGKTPTFTQSEKEIRQMIKAKLAQPDLKALVEKAGKKAEAVIGQLRSKIRDIVKAGSIRKVNEALEQELDKVEVGEGKTGASLVEDEMRTAERYAKEAEDMEKIRKKVSMRRKLAAGLVCSGAGYLVGTLSAAAIGTITPTIPKLTITIDTQTNTIKVGDLRIGG